MGIRIKREESFYICYAQKLGDENFSNSLKNYLTSYRNKSVETDDLRKVMEDESGISLERFFDQWVYRKGHPVLDIDILLSKEDLKVVVKQINQSITNQNLNKTRNSC